MKIKYLISIIAVIVSVVLLYDYANRGKSCGGGDDFVPPTAEEKHYHDSVVNAQSPIVQQMKDSIQRGRDKEMDEKIYFKEINNNEK